MNLDFEKMPRFKRHTAQILPLLAEWADVHNVPVEAVVDQLYTAHAWCNANPKRAPKKDPVRFLWSWMRQASRWGNLKSKLPPAAVTKEHEPEMSYEEMVAIRRKNMGRAA